MTCCAIIVAAGKGLRAGRPKQFVKLRGHTVLWHSVQPFLRHPEINEVRVVTAANAANAADYLAAMPAKVRLLPVGGQTRRQSVLNGLRGLADTDWALVHDAARPCLSDAELTRLLRHAGTDAIGGLLACPLVDCLKQADNGRTQHTLPRNNKWLAQTPQMFRAGPLYAALAAADDGDDEAHAMEQAGYAPLLVKGEATNIKITRADDFSLATAILAAKQ